MIGFFGLSMSVDEKLIMRQLLQSQGITIVLFSDLCKLVLNQIVYLFQPWIILDFLLRVICFLLALRSLGTLGHEMSSRADG